MALRYTNASKTCPHAVLCLKARPKKSLKLASGGKKNPRKSSRAAGSSTNGLCSAGPARASGAVSKWKTVLAEPGPRPLSTDPCPALLAGMLTRPHGSDTERLFSFPGSQPGRASDTLPATGILTMRHTRPGAGLIISSSSLSARSSRSPCQRQRAPSVAAHIVSISPLGASIPERGPSDLKLNETKDGPDRRTARKQRLTSQNPLPPPSNPAGQGEGTEHACHTASQ